MREHHEPALVPVPRSKTLTDDVVRHAAEAPDGIALARRVGGTWVEVTASRFAEEVRAVARGLIATGVQPGDRVAIMSRTRYEWTLADYAVWWAGGVVVPIYETSSAEQVEWILSDSGAVAVFLESARHVEVFAEVSDRVPGVRDVHVFDDGGLDALAGQGAGIADDELEARRTSRGPDDLATIIYTSGTTGRPRTCRTPRARRLGRCSAWPCSQRRPRPGCSRRARGRGPRARRRRAPEWGRGGRHRAG